MTTLAPSILSADFAQLGQQISELEQAGTKVLHIDVMDGVFVPSISFGFPIIRSIRKKTEMFFDVHLMITDPERYVEEFARSGSDSITIHVEACDCVSDTLDRIRSLGVEAGISLNPGTPLSDIYPYLEQVDRVLVMTVNAGFGGQQYIEECTDKIIMLRREIDRRRLPVTLEIDGGVNKENVKHIMDAGADVLVSGSAVFNGNLTENMRYFLDVMK